MCGAEGAEQKRRLRVRHACKRGGAWDAAANLAPGRRRDGACTPASAPTPQPSPAQKPTLSRCRMLVSGAASRPSTLPSRLFSRNSPTRSLSAGLPMGLPRLASPSARCLRRAGGGAAARTCAGIGRQRAVAREQRRCLQGRLGTPAAAAAQLHTCLEAWAPQRRAAAAQGPLGMDAAGTAPQPAALQSSTKERDRALPGTSRGAPEGVGHAVEVARPAHQCAGIKRLQVQGIVVECRLAGGG